MPKRDCNRCLLILGMLVMFHCGGGESAASSPDVKADGPGDDVALDSGVADNANAIDVGVADDVSARDIATPSDDAPDAERDATARDAEEDRTADASRFDGDASLDSEPPLADGQPTETDGIADTPIKDAAPEVSTDGAGDDVVADVATEAKPVDAPVPIGIISVQPTTGLATNETGTSTSFTMVLGLLPSADVTVNLSSTRLDEGTVAPAQVTFTPANWNVPQTIIVTGVDDTFCDGEQLYMIVTAPSTSLDPNYLGVDPDDVAVRNVDNEGGGITVSSTNLTTTEAGASATFTVVLNCEPLATVTVPIASQAASEVTVAPTAVAFTPATWHMPHTVTVTGVDDNVADGDKVVTVNVGPSSSPDPGFDGLVGPNVSVTNLDDD